MAEEETKKDVVEEPTEAPSEGVTTEFKVDVSGVAEMIAKQNAVIEALLKRVEIAEAKTTPHITEKKDETKGIVKEVAKEVEEKIETGLVIEKADFGKGFQLYRDYSKEDCKFKRLAR